MSAFVTKRNNDSNFLTRRDEKLDESIVFNKENESCLEDSKAIQELKKWKNHPRRKNDLYCLLFISNLSIVFSSSDSRCGVYVNRNMKILEWREGAKNNSLIQH